MKMERERRWTGKVIDVMSAAAGDKSTTPLKLNLKKTFVCVCVCVCVRVCKSKQATHKTGCTHKI